MNMNYYDLLKLIKDPVNVNRIFRVSPFPFPFLPFQTPATQAIF